MAPELVEMVTFGYYDLVADSKRKPAEGVFFSYDLILCRNVLIYFQPHVQERILSRLLDMLNPFGYLVLGTSESLPYPLSERMEEVWRGARIYRRRLFFNGQFDRPWRKQYVSHRRVQDRAKPEV